MIKPFRIFIGYDAREAIAYHVLCHSIITRARQPVSITPLRRETLPAFKRKRGPHDSTDFAISRFLVPYLCGYKGHALFIDCDMLALTDITALDDIALINTTLHDWHVAVVKHNYKPRSDKKFLSQNQTTYQRKNWSSVMLFDCAACSALTLDYVTRAPGLDLHQFKWIKDDKKIHALDPAWNSLIGEECELPVSKSKLLHFTRGGPWFEEHDEKTEACAAWWAEYRALGRFKP